MSTTGARPVRIGCSGWSYRAWRGDFYPAGLRQRDELSYLAARTGAVELNGSFYSLQRPSSYAAWRDATPPGYRVCVKGGRFITHLKRLRDPRRALANFLASGVLALGDRTGPLLWQLPADLPLDTALLGDFLDLLPRSTAAAARLAAEHDDKLPADRALVEAPEDRPLQHVLEPRHPSFGTEEARALLSSAGVGLVVSDGAGRWPMFLDVTSEVVYVRLHGSTELYVSRYTDDELDRWAERCRDWATEADVHVFLDNDSVGHAPWDALRLQERLGDLAVVAGRRGTLPDAGGHGSGARDAEGR